MNRNKLILWLPSCVFVMINLLHAVVLPPFEGFDEPAHLSTLLHYSTDQGRPIPGQSWFHASVEEAMACVPGPVDQLAGWNSLGGLSYEQWKNISLEQREALSLKCSSLSVAQWRTGTKITNWQAQHPPLYYFLTGNFLRLFSFDNLWTYHRAARVLSALLFSVLGFILSYFLLIRWKLSLASAWFAVFLPMLYVMGSRITNDALAIPLFSCALLLMLEELMFSGSSWSFRKWMGIALFCALTLGTKAYVLALVPVFVLIFVYGLWQNRKTLSPRMLYPLLPGVLMLVFWGWWLFENYQRTGSMTGQNELGVLREKGLDHLGARLSALVDLYWHHSMGALRMWGVVGVQMLYTSHWTIGAAFAIFYPLQLLAFSLPFWFWYRKKQSIRSLILHPALVLSVLVFAAFLYGTAKLVLDFYMITGQAKGAAGWYAWSASALWVALVGVAFQAFASPRKQIIIVALQALCFCLAMASSYSYWSGTYVRHPVFRYPVLSEKMK